jgi:hypothetical protein
MNEVTAPLPEEAVAQKIEIPAEWTLLNANTFKGTSTPEGETAETEAEEQESSNNLLTIAAPPAVIEPQPLRPLGLTITLPTVAIKEQENTVEEVNVTRPAPVERGGESAPKPDLAFAAKIISKEDVTVETPEVKPEAKLEARPEVKVEAKPEAKPEAKFQAMPEAKPEAKPEIAAVEPRPVKVPAAATAQHAPSEPAEERKLEVQHSTEAVETPETATPKLEAAMPAAVPVKNSTVQQSTASQPVQQATRIIEIEPPVEPRTTEPVREVAVAIDGAEGRVRLRMETHAGELRAWVTGNNAETVERVRAELPELSRGLKDAGVRAELWRPDSTRETRAAAELQGGSEYGHRSAEGNDRQYDDGSRRRRPQPDWFEQEDE